MKTFQHWNSVRTKKPKPYQQVRAKGIWKCSDVLYLDDSANGWEQKKSGNIEVTHWKAK